jgi:cobyrinic acid a,c-diamide synthase
MGTYLLGVPLVLINSREITIKMEFPRIMIAGVHSRVGKTTVTLGLMDALKSRGLAVQGFKVGPDYIDPGLHFYATGRKSHNLDSWMGSEEVVKTIFVKNAQKADLSIIEGAMGLFDGVRNQRIKGSSAEIALILGTPVILIVNAEGIAQSLIPLIKGYLNYLTGLNVKGIILNNSSFYHREWVKKSIEEELGVKVLGCLGKNERVKMAERHLGLVPAGENPELRSTIHLLGQWISEELDIDEIIMIAKSSGEIRLEKKEAHLVNKVNNDVAIAIAMDEAFCFCYQDNLDYMHELGADTKYFSPLYDRAIPEADGIYIGGGFPEMFWEQLSGNQSMIQSIIAAYRNR